MRFALLLVVAAACGGPSNHPSTPPIPYTADFSALRWAPEKPTYILAARTVAGAQHAIVDAIDSFGIPFGASAVELSRELAQVLHIDPLSAEVASKLGVDLAGGFAVFSDDVNPTFVIHLAGPEVARAFFEHLREQGMQSQSQIVEGVDINTNTLAPGFDVSWAIERDWLWVHLAIKSRPEEANAWFVHAHHAASAAWTDGFGWATQLADKLASHASGLVGFIAAQDLLNRMHAAHKVTQEMLACTKLYAPLGRVAVAIDSDGHHTSGRIAIELGSAAHDLAGHILAPPPGLDAASAGAPLAAQWNLDLDAIVAWWKPCEVVSPIRPSALADRFGIRAARATLLAMDPGRMSGSGVVALDLSSKSFLESELDEIPHRSMFESNHTYGTRAGHRISIPLALTIDYVLDDHSALVAVGDGLLDKIVTGAAAAPPPIAAIDVHPLAMTPEAWEWLFDRLVGGETSKRIVDHLMMWRDAHLGMSIDHEALIFEATGNRR